jgi:D-inositol-3-phosphate glycosyltransferase
VRIALFGGVFESPMAEYALSAPENVLKRYLEEAGHEVEARSISRAPSLAVPADVYHAHHFGPAAYALAVAGAGPFVFTSHNPFLATGKADESRLEHALQRAVLTAADVVVALSEREADALAGLFGVDRQRVAVIPNGLDLGLYGPPPVQRTGSVRLLTVGQLTPYKGHKVLLEALALRPETTLEIASHRHDLRPQLEARARELGVAVEFTGPFDTAGLAARYRACDVYVQPSFAEAFPITILEAMACGRPIVATDVGGVAEEVGDAGIVVPPGDAAALAAAIGRLVDSPEERVTRGATALERVRTHYDGRLIAAGHAELYAGLEPARRSAHAARRLVARVALGAYARRNAVGRLVPAGLKRRG